MNVRCPSCEALFPVSGTLFGEASTDQEVNCPVCLTRFPAEAHEVKPEAGERLRTQRVTLNPSTVQLSAEGRIVPQEQGIEVLGGHVSSIFDNPLTTSVGPARRPSATLPVADEPPSGFGPARSPSGPLPPMRPVAEARSQLATDAVFDVGRKKGGSHRAMLERAATPAAFRDADVGRRSTRPIPAAPPTSVGPGSTGLELDAGPPGAGTFAASPSRRVSESALSKPSFGAPAERLVSAVAPPPPEAGQPSPATGTFEPLGGRAPAGRETAPPDAASLGVPRSEAPGQAPTGEPISQPISQGVVDFSQLLDELVPGVRKDAATSTTGGDEASSSLFSSLGADRPAAPEAPGDPLIGRAPSRPAAPSPVEALAATGRMATLGGPGAAGAGTEDVFGAGTPPPGRPGRAAPPPEPAPSDGGLYDLDTGPSGRAGISTPGGLSPPRTTPSSTSLPGGIAARRGGTAPRTERRSTGTSRRAAPNKRVLTIGAAVLLVGLGLGLTDHGYFGVNLLFPPPAPSATSSPKVALHLDEVPELPDLDTLDRMTQAIEQADAMAEADPRDPKAAHRALVAFAELWERYPADYLANNRWPVRIEELRKRDPDAPVRLDVLSALSGGHVKEAVAAARKLLGQEPDDNSVRARALLRLHRREVIDRALANPGLVAGPESDPLSVPGPTAELLKEAEVAISAARTAEPKRLKFKVLDADVRIARGEYKRAVELLEGVLKDSPDHLEARVYLAEALAGLKEVERPAELLAQAAGLSARSKGIDIVHRIHLVRARLAAMRGDAAAQVEALEAANVAMPDDELLAVRIGRLHLKADKPDDAGRRLLDCKRRECGSIAYEVALCTYWLRVKRLDDAQAELDLATKKFPDSVDLLYLRAQVEFFQKRLLTARELLLQVLQREPAHAQAIMAIVQVLPELGRKEEAVRILEDARKRLGPVVPLLDVLAKLYDELGRTVDAREVLGVLLDAEPNNKRYLLRAASYDLDAGDVDRAAQLLDRVRKLSAIGQESAIVYGRVMQKKGRAKEGWEVIHGFVDQAPGDVELNTLGASLLIDTKDAASALLYLNRALAIRPRNAETLYEYGRAELQLHHLSEAVTKLRTAVGFAPEHVDYRFALAEALFDAKSIPGSRRMAVKELEEIVQVLERSRRTGKAAVDNPEVYRMLGRAAAEAGRFPLAHDHYSSLLSIDPEDADALARKGEALYHMSKEDAARPLLLKALERDPRMQRAAYVLGLIANARSKTTEAIDRFLSVVRHGPGEFYDAHFFLGMLYKDRGQKGLAREHLETWLKLAPPESQRRSEAKLVLGYL